MKSMMRKTTRREIKNSFGRYMAILAIIALGVGFFAGLKVTKPTMVTIVNDYVENQALFDYRLLCTLGFEEEDVEAFRGLEDVRAAEGSVFSDVIYQYGDGGANQVASVHSITENVNMLDLKAGRMPESPDECVVDSKIFSEDAIGEQIMIAGENNEDTLGLMRYETYTIVGLVTSPIYLNYERGSSSIGNGVVVCFIYIPLEGFEFEYYSEIYVKLDGDEQIYSDAYEAYIEEHTDRLEEVLDERTRRRQNAVISEIQTQIDDAQAELNEKAAEAWSELEDAEEQLQSAQEELDTAEEELAKQKSALEDGIGQLTEGITQAADGIDRLSDGIEQARAGLLEIQAGIARYDSYLEPFAQILAGGVLPESLPQEQYMQYRTLTEGRAALAEQESEISGTIAALSEQKSELETQKEALESQLAQAEEGLRQIADGYAELADARETLADSRAEYEEGLTEYQEQIADGQAEIDEAQEELDKMEEASYYLLDRDTNVGYVCFESDSNIVEEIADVFPVFFFLVAVLVCMTTMNRMIEEQRTQIGVLKALGYSKSTIMAKYMIYSGSAAMTGCIFGYALGTWLFPKVIWIAYGILYNMGGSAYIFDLPLALISIVVSLFCSIGTTWLSCRIELGSVAAELIRPKSPKNGKRIFLEYIPFLWKRIKFLHKVSIRNIFRYKKRFFMMVIGISGCTALVLTGLGLQDSIMDVVNEQYGRIQTYDISVTLKEEPDDAMQAAFEEKTEGALEAGFYYMSASVDLTYQGRTKSITIIIPKEEEMLADFLGLWDEDGGEIPYPSQGEAVISRKFAEKQKIQVGDTVSLRDGDMNSITVAVSGICDNYVGDYLYLSADTYERQLGKAPVYKNMWCNLVDGADSHEVGTLLMEDDNISSVSITDDIVVRVESMLDSMDYVIALVIGCAAALAFIVLYNLTNINITERIREIATIKVLGFYPVETASYVFRENLALTGMGALVGLALGQWLHWFVMKQLDIDGVSFQVKILPVSYVWAIVLTFVFAMLVNGLMYFKLQKIDMAESLKSIE